MPRVSQLDPKDYDETPEAQAQRWTAEFSAARERLKTWHKQADEVINEYLDERTDGAAEKKLNIFTSSTQTKMAMLYGNTPDVSVERTFGDAEDDEARVGGELLERVLNSDLERTGDNFQTAQQLAGWDYLVPGLGMVWLRYVSEFEEVPETPAIMGLDPVTGTEFVKAQPVPAHEKKVWEDVETDWVHHKDVLWNPCRVWHERRWVARKLDMPKETFDERFAALGEDLLAMVPVRLSKPRDEGGEAKSDPLASVDVWEIWSRRDKKQIFFVEGFGRTVETNDDPLGLEDFFPCPEPMIANPSTNRLVPRPDFVLYQDQYKEIHQLTTRIGLLRQAVRVAGLYDKQSAEVKNLLDPNKSNENKMYPCDSWAAFAEKGGIQGAMAMLPLADIVNALTVLRENRAELVQDVFQVTGMSDIMRGQAVTSGATATEQAIKARFGSVRMQALQDRAAKFAADTQRIRAEIICKHFDPQTIIERSNCERSYDAQLAQAGVAFLKSGFSELRIAVKPDSMSLTDFAQMKTERMEVLQAVGGYLQVAGGIAQAMPGSTAGLVKILKHLVAGLKGCDGLESILDEMATQAEQAAQAAAMNPQQAPPDPKVVAQQMKGQQDMEKVQAELQADLIRTKAEVDADAQREANQMQFNVLEHQKKQQISAALRPPQIPGGPRNGKT